MHEAGTFQDLLDALGELVLETVGPLDAPVSGAESDSRRIRPGDCFVAIRGSRDDGLRHWPSARKAGAVALITEEPPPPPHDVPVARVSDSYAAAGRVAERVFGHPASHMRLFGITGTNGKTTCAFLLERILAAAGRRTALIGTVMYKMGGATTEADRTTPMPFALQKLLDTMRRENVEDTVIEVSSHSLAQRRLGTASFDGALFTNLSGDHLDYHRDMETYYEAKRRLFVESLADGAPAVVNIDDAYGNRLCSELRNTNQCQTLSLSMRSQEADFHLESIATDVAGSRATLTSARGIIPPLAVQTPMIGHFNLCNAGCVAALALSLGIDRTAIEQEVSAFKGAPGRLQPIRLPGRPAVFVDYAHTDDALDNVLRALNAVKRQRLFLVFGCGGDRDRTKRPRMAAVAETHAERIYATSDNPRTENPETILDDVCAGFSPGTAFRRIADRRQAIRSALAEASPEDIVLVAGKGHETYQEISGVKHPFDDCREVRKALEYSPGHPQNETSCDGMTG